MAHYAAVTKAQVLALRSLRRNKLQTALTMTGMSIGVATVLTTMSLGAGAQKAIQDQVRAAGMNVIVVTAGNYKMKQQWTSDGETSEPQAQLGPSVPATSPVGDASAHLLPTASQVNRNPATDREDDEAENAAGLGGSERLILGDAEAVAGIKGVQYVAAGLSDNARVQWGEEGWFTKFLGTGADLAMIRRTWIFPHGRFFTAEEVKQGKSVAVIGSIASERLFGIEDPVGKVITAKGGSYKIVGEIGSGSWLVPAAAGDGQFDALYVPVTTAQAVLHRESLTTLTVSTVSTGDVTKVGKAITALLRQRHGLTASEPDDFVVASEAHRSLAKGGMRTDIARAVVGNVSNLDKVTLDELGKTLDRASRTMTALLASIAAVSLIVGGIGIMNIMLLAVTERTREIGIRRAVGGRRADVMLQFLMEAVLLSVSSGLLGILTGILAARSIAATMQWSSSVAPWTVALSFAISAGIGIAFGYYPARQASLVAPMDALRYE